MIPMTDEGERLLPDLVRFGKGLIKSQDIDPLYPVLRDLVDGMGFEEAYWLQHLYVAWYNLPSGWRAWIDMPMPESFDPELIDPRWPTGTERRANRGGKVIAHLSSTIDTIDKDFEGDIVRFFTDGIFEPEDSYQPTVNWMVMNERLQGLYLNGRWAAYKQCEVLRRVMDVPLEAPDMGMQFSSGPREGLAMLYGEVPGQTRGVINQLDAQARDLQERALAMGLEADIEELETVLCNFKSLRKGKYYIGHDIDELQEQIDVAIQRGILSVEQAEPLWQARREMLPEQYLGEIGGWHGVDKQRNQSYARTGKVLRRI